MERAALYKKWARLYFEAALAADHKIGHLPGYEIIAPPPVMMNCGHAIELCIKALLLDDGESAERVRGFSHKLADAWQHLKQRRPSLCAELGDEDEDLLSLFSESHEQMSFRYGEPNSSGTMPVFAPTQLLVEKFLMLSGAPTFEELEA